MQINEFAYTYVILDAKRIVNINETKVEKLFHWKTPGCYRSL